MISSKLILGTAQFGLEYGINNSIGKPTQRDVFEILDYAADHHIEYLDTADAYGNSINLIGTYHKNRNNQFKILSKFKGAKKGDLYSQLTDSLNKLMISSFEVYSYHSFTDYLNHPFLKEELQILKNDGKTRKIGISIYSNSELEQVINDDCIDVIQLPYNLLDNQNVRGHFIEKAKLHNKEIHTRSVFLQGLLFMQEEAIPEKLMQLKPYLRIIKSFCNKESINIYSLALSYAIYNKNIDSVLIGVDTKNQLLHNIESISELISAFEYINQNIYVKEIDLLNPVNWK